MVMNALTSELITERLLLRPATSEDAPLLFRVNSDPEVIRYTDDPSFRDESEARAFLVKLLNSSSLHQAPYVIQSAATSDTFGWCGVLHDFGNNDFHLEFRLTRNAWGKGIATEAARASLLDAFHRLGMLKLRARCVRENIGASRVLLKLGFRRVGSFFARGYLCDEYVLYRHEIPFGSN